MQLWFIWQAENPRCRCATHHEIQGLRLVGDWRQPIANQRFVLSMSRRHLCTWLLPGCDRRFLCGSPGCAGPGARSVQWPSQALQASQAGIEPGRNRWQPRRSWVFHALVCIKHPFLSVLSCQVIGTWPTNLGGHSRITLRSTGRLKPGRSAAGTATVGPSSMQRRRRRASCPNFGRALTPAPDDATTTAETSPAIDFSSRVTGCILYMW